MEFKTSLLIFKRHEITRENINAVKVRKSRKKICCPGFFQKTNAWVFLCTKNCPSLRVLEKSRTTYLFFEIFWPLAITANNSLRVTKLWLWRFSQHSWHKFILTNKAICSFDICNCESSQFYQKMAIILENKAFLKLKLSKNVLLN